MTAYNQQATLKMALAALAAAKAKPINPLPPARSAA